MEITRNEREEFLRHFPVSHETLAKLDRYAELLSEWNVKFNLVSENSLAHVWQRHFLDSAQLLPRLLCATRNRDCGSFRQMVIADLGSGAGFPGLVLAIMGVAGIHLIESIGKKADFLRAIAGELSLDVAVEHGRIEDSQLKADVVTARALKPLPELLALAKPLMKKDSLCLLLKGRHSDVELTESTKYWKFESETIPSLSDSSGRVLIIRNPERKAKVGFHGAAKSRRRRP
jgi:16S rRNA (guanine527-N7)-methyltransferase